MSAEIYHLPFPSDEWLDRLVACARLLGVEGYDLCELPYIIDRWEAGAHATDVAADLWGPLGRTYDGQ